MLSLSNYIFHNYVYFIPVEIFVLVQRLQSVGNMGKDKDITKTKKKKKVSSSECMFI
jgi:hypothetical protein